MSELLERKLARAMGRAIADFDMIEYGDRVMVCVSGGKDSYTMLHLLRDLSRRAPVRFELKVVNIDQGHPGYPADRLRTYMRAEDYDFRMIEERQRGNRVDECRTKAVHEPVQETA